MTNPDEIEFEFHQKASTYEHGYCEFVSSKRSINLLFISLYSSKFNCIKSKNVHYLSAEGDSTFQYKEIIMQTDDYNVVEVKLRYIGVANHFFPI